MTQFKESSPPTSPIHRVLQASIDAQTAWEIRPVLMKLLYLQGPNIQVDLSEVHFIDSTGLGMLVGVHKEARERDGAVCLLNPSREVRRILQATGLDSLFAAQRED